MSGNEFHLPGSSIDEIEKIIDAYAHRGEPSSNPEIAALTGLSKETVSRNNKFLIAVGVIEGGQKKRATELGKRLGRALHHGETDDVRRYWREAVTSNTFLSEQITAVRVQKGIKVDSLPGKILYNASATKNKATETGARAVADILVRAGLLEVSGDVYRVAKGTSRPAPPEATAPQGAQPPPVKEDQRPPSIQKPREVVVTDGFQVAINLQLQLPEFEDPKKYEELFRALRKHLLQPTEDE